MTYILQHTTSNDHTMIFDEPLTSEELIPIVQKLLETTNIDKLIITKNNTKQNYNLLKTFIKLFNHEVYGLVLRESLFQVPNNTYWPFELIDEDDIPEIHINDNIKVAHWLWTNLFSIQHKKHFEELIKIGILPNDV